MTYITKSSFLLPAMLLLLCFCVGKQVRAQQVDWAYQVGNLDNNEEERLLIDPEGNVYGIGNFSDSLDFNPGPQVAGIRSNGGSDVYIKKSSPDGALIWVKRIGGTSDESRSGAALDEAGNLYLAINCYGNVDVDPGPGVYTQGVGDALLKLDKNGNFVWALKFTDFSQNLALSSIVISHSGAIYIGGAFKNSHDFDPGPGTFTLSAKNDFGWPDAFLMKLDASGNFQWAGKWGEVYSDYVTSIALDHKGNILANGLFKLNVDFDPGAGQSFLNAVTQALFISKFDTSGNFIWVKSLPSADVGGFKLDANDNIIAGSYFYNTQDFDPGPGVFNLTANGGYRDIFLTKLDADGNFLWAKNMGGNGEDEVKALDVDELGNIYSTGSFQLTADFDPGPDSLLLVSTVSCGFILKTDFLGNTLWAKQFSGRSEGLIIKVAPNGSIYTSGYFISDVTLNPGHTPPYYFISIGADDCYVMKLKQDFNFSGTVFNDLNGNGARDANEPGLRGFHAAARIKDKHAFSNPNGDFHFYDNILGDTVTIIPPWPGWTIQPAFAIANAAQSPMNFAAFGPPVKDIRVAAVETVPFRPLFGTDVVMLVTNFGSTPVNDLALTLKINSPATPGVLNLVETSLPPSMQTVSQIDWIIPHIDPDQTVVIRIKMRASISMGIGQLVDISISAPLDMDILPANNTAHIHTISVGSFDPNEKQVTPANVAREALDTTTLQYVIRFQNTGTYPADFVVIRDTLPAGLDLSTLQVLAASHPYSWRLFGPRVLEFRFDPIHLPDSTSNEPESHGYVLFSVKAKSDLPVGTHLNNRAGIYFDYNAPVITNTSTMEVVNVVQVTEPGEALWIDFGISPNPVPAFSRVAVDLSESVAVETLVSVKDVFGRELQSLKLEKGVNRVTLNGLPAGSYFVQVRAGKQTGAKVLIVE